ncbi:uncharacterized protein LOC110432274 [Sorghum bicolor]|uniref:uncharacterized protein LOC110432274 n=1 Tax=Sorghum bicolor TaxID=4558 RepID=UPI000B4262AB|nr:uncharacterized protein LOC110432274 [Sorghum bicolor]|eukprot:XP_021308022.1 uncharacterized protein LOC110432274 [Sorghum bicolor]
MRILSYGMAADMTDEYVRIGESTALDSVRHFVRAVVELFGDEYLRHPNEADTARLLAMGAKKGFPGMLGSIDCMHWAWKNYPYEKQDGIYPPWATLIQSISRPVGNKRQYFAKAQEAARKMVERAFGVLQSRFAIVRGGARFWDIDTLAVIMRACVIMHNMIVEDEGFVVDHNEEFENQGDNVEIVN